MPKKREPLEERLSTMADDIQIGGDTCFRAMALAVVLCNVDKSLTEEQRKDMERLLSRAERLLSDLRRFWDRHPDLERLVDRGRVAASEAGSTNWVQSQRKEQP